MNSADFLCFPLTVSPLIKVNGIGRSTTSYQVHCWAAVIVSLPMGMVSRENKESMFVNLQISYS